MTKHQPRVHTNSPVRSSPRPWVPDGTGAPSAFPRASHPAITRGARRGRGQVIEHGPEPTLYVIDLASNPALITRYVRPRVALADAALSARLFLSPRIQQRRVVEPGRRSSGSTSGRRSDLVRSRDCVQSASHMRCANEFRSNPGYPDAAGLPLGGSTAGSVVWAWRTMVALDEITLRRGTSRARRPGVSRLGRRPEDRRPLAAHA